MKKSVKSMLGVTLLEVMLVLAIAAMIIVMSIRYYQQAGTSNQVNQTMSEVISIASAADGLYQGTGSYAAASNAVISPITGASTLVTPWGAAITVAGTATTVTMTFAVAASTAVCPLLTAKIRQNSKFAINAACTIVTYTP